MHRSYTAKLLAVLPSRSAAISAPQADLVEALTERELDVLRLIAAGLTYEEIAQKLIVSVNTVRFHVKAIYGKLDVNKRTLAIDKACALHLI